MPVSFCHSVSISRHQARRPISCFFNLTDQNMIGFFYLGPRAVCMHQILTASGSIVTGRRLLCFVSTCSTYCHHLLVVSSTGWLFARVISGKAPACRPQNTMPIFLSWIGAWRSWQIGRAGARMAQEWHRNGRANEIHLGTVLPSGLNWHLRRYDVQEWCMNFWEVPRDHLGSNSCRPLGSKCSQEGNDAMPWTVA